MNLAQYSANNAWNLNWNNGNTNNNNKNNTNYVRAFSEYLVKMEERSYIIDLEDALEAYYECRRNKRRTANALLFEANYESNCVELWREINEKTYAIGRSIAFIVTNPKPREVFAADFRDRIVHHLVARRLEPLFESIFIEDTYNCRKGKGTLYGVKRLAQKVNEISKGYSQDCFIGKFDMQGFFMSIHKPTLNGMLQSFIDKKYYGRDKELIKWLTECIVLHSPEKNCIRKSPIDMWGLIDENKSLFKNGDDYGLAIGNLTSQMFANFYLHKFDEYMAACYDGYGRYVDDFYVIDRSKDKILRGISDSASYLRNNLGVALHPQKMYLQHYSKGVKFVGSVIKPYRDYVGNRTIGNMTERIMRYNALAESGEVEPYIDSFVSSINSYIGFSKHYASYNLRSVAMKSISPKWWRVCRYTSGINKVIKKAK